MARKFFLIDGHSHLYRAFYAVRGLTSPEGRPTNAVFGFTSMLRKLRADYKPDYLAVAFDTPAPTFRHEMFKEYKATREKPPDEFIAQIPMIREVLDAMQIPIFSKEGYEADDVLGTVARLAADCGIEVFLVTGDKDAAQLLSPSVHVFDSAKNRVITEETLREESGIAPSQVVDVMALEGDSTDNIPGVPQIGPKTARALILQYKTMEGVLAHADEIKSARTRENLKQYAGQARLSRKLATIDTHVPIDVDLEKCRDTLPESSRLGPIYRKLGFRQFLADLSGEATRDADAKYHLVDSDKLFEQFLSELRKQPKFSVDLETTSASPMLAKIVGLSFAWREKEAWYLPVLGPLGEKTLDCKNVLAALKPILTDPAVGKIGQNLKYDALVLRNYGIEMDGIVFDTMIAAYVLNPERRRYGLDELAAELCEYRMIPITDLIGKGKKQITMDQVPIERVGDYSCADADIALRCATILEKEVRAQGMWELFADIEVPLVSVLVDMEFEGIELDSGALRAMSGELDRQIAELEKEIYEKAGKKFNIGSPRQLAGVLFDDLKLAKGRRTKTGASTDSEVLAQLAIAHKLPALVLEYRQLAKLKSTYVDALPKVIVPRTGKLHTSFNQTATATGRLSSSDPNLQNIPIRTELGEGIRKAFVASQKDNILLSADYSQIELRIMAHISGDVTLRKAFEQDADIHQFVAAQIHNVPPEEVTPTMRHAAKAVNFGIIYGLTPYGLSRDLGIPIGQAEAFIDEYFKRYPGVKRFIDETIASARKSGSISTLCGRRRLLPGLSDSNGAVRSFAERAAVNTVIQGTAADMIKLAMIRIRRRLREEKVSARMLLQIHDELLFELPVNEQERVAAVVVEEMSGALKMDVPIKVNVAVGKNWLEAK